MSARLVVCAFVRLCRSAFVCVCLQVRLLDVFVRSFVPSFVRLLAYLLNCMLECEFTDCIYVHFCLFRLFDSWLCCLCVV